MVSRLLLAAALAGVLVVGGCGAERPELAQPGVERVVDDSPTVVVEDGPGVVRLAVDGWTGDPTDAGPADLGRRIIADLLYEGLTRLDDAGDPAPALAADWTVTPDRLTWVFELDPQVVDSTGQPITSRVVMKSLDRVAARGRDDLVAPTLEAIAGWGDRMDGRTGGVAGITAPSEERLVIRLEEPFEPLTEVLAAPAFGVVTGPVDERRSTGSYMVDPATGLLVPRDVESGLAAIEVVTATPAEGWELLHDGRVDWAVVDGADDGGDEARLASVVLDVSVGVAVRGLSPAQARGVLEALDPVGLSDAVGLVPFPPRATDAPVDMAPAVVVHAPPGQLGLLSEAAADQLGAAGIDVKIQRHDGAGFGQLVVGDVVGVHPVVVAGGSWSAEVPVDGLAPGGSDDMVGVPSQDRLALVASIVETQDAPNRAVLVDSLEQAALDEGVVVLVGRLEVLVASRSDGLDLGLRADGTLDLGPNQ